MKALVYKGPGFKAVEDRPVPQIAAPTDAIVKNHQDHHLRHGSAYPQGRCPDLRARADPRS